MHTVFDRFLAWAFSKTDKVANGSVDLLFGEVAILALMALCFLLTGANFFMYVAVVAFLLCVQSVIFAGCAEGLSHLISSAARVKTRIFGGNAIVFRPDKPMVIKKLADTFTKLGRITPNRTLCIANATPQGYNVRTHVSPSRSAFCRAPRTQKRSTSSSNSSRDDDSASSDPSDQPQLATSLASQFLFYTKKLDSKAFVRHDHVHTNTPLLIGVCLDGGCPA